MKKLIAPLGLGIALVLLASSAALAAPSAAPLPAFLAAAPAPGGGSPSLAALFGAPAATPADTCGIPRYFCQSCTDATNPERLCSERICGTFVILNCGDCAPRCILPPA